MDNRRIPTPFYAAAGAGDLAYQQLRRLSDRLARGMRSAADGGTDLRGVAGERANQLRTRAVRLRGEVRQRATGMRERAAGMRTGTADRDLRAELIRLGGAAQREALVAQQRATAYYNDLVHRGERVVRGAEITAADAALQAATQLESTAATPAPEPAGGDGATATARPAKRTRPATRKQTSA